MYYVHDLLATAARAVPDHPAIADGAGRFSYRELLDRSLAAAAYLRGHGLANGDRFMFPATSGNSTAALLFGASLAGVTAVPVSDAATPSEIEYMARDCGASLLLADDRIPDAGPGALSEVVAGPSRPHTETAILIYTSGSTSRPKAVIVPHRQALFSVDAITQVLKYRADDRVYCRLPLSFDYGLYQILLACRAGAELIIDAPGINGDVLTRIDDAGATVVPLVPALAAMLLRVRNRGVDDSRGGTVRLFTNTGEELSVQVAEQLRSAFPKAKLQLMYGTTECKRISIMEPDGDRVRPGSVGRPLPGTTVRITDHEGVPVPVSCTGEITVLGPHVMPGYWNAPELTAEVFRSDPGTGQTWLHTGDQGFLDADGYLYFVGRSKEVFKLRGVRTSTIEIEAAARMIDGVDDAAVLPPESTRDAVLFVSCPSSALNGVETLAALRRVLTRGKVPSHCVVLDRIPRGINGKIDRSALAEFAP